MSEEKRVYELSFYGWLQLMLWTFFFFFCLETVVEVAMKLVRGA